MQGGETSVQWVATVTDSLESEAARRRRRRRPWPTGSRRAPAAEEARGVPSCWPLLPPAAPALAQRAEQAWG